VRLLCAAVLSMLWLPSAAADERTPIACADCDEWNRAQKPFRVFGNTYYVGTRGLAAVLLTSPSGHVLFDGALPQSVPLIEANIRALGFRVKDVKLIVNSHAHFDHAGGIAALEADSGATVAASRAGAAALRDGHPPPEDPQAGFGLEKNRFPKVAEVRAIVDGEKLEVGPLAVTAHLTPGHTPGSTTWTWRSCEGTRCADVVYADSLNGVAAPGFRFSGSSGHADISGSFAASIAKVAALPCDILLTVHPGFGELFEKAASNPAGGGNAFINRQACRVYAESARHKLETRLAEEN
jgi:metallo-beta-lactamase class B